MTNAQNKKENIFLSLVLNVIAPVLIMNRGHDYLGSYLNPREIFFIALALPLGYGLYDLAGKKKLNFLSLIGVAHVATTGILKHLELDLFWFAVKEAAFPSIIGIAVFLSMWTKKPLIKALLWNDQVMNIPAIESALQEHNKESEFEASLTKATYLVVVSFALSAVINFALARLLLKSPPDSQAFNEEFSYMTAVSYPVIMISCSSLLVFALWRLVSNLKSMTGMDYDAMFNTGNTGK